MRTPMPTECWSTVIMISPRGPMLSPEADIHSALSNVWNNIPLPQPSPTDNWHWNVKAVYRGPVDWRADWVASPTPLRPLESALISIVECYLYKDGHGACTPDEHEWEAVATFLGFGSVKEMDESLPRRAAT